MVELVITGDGSSSLLLTGKNEHYHSIHGAIQESQHVFIEAGLNHVFKQANKQALRVLEIGFGTGLNAFLTYLFCKQHLGLHIDYVGLEPFPVAPDLIKAFNYPEQLQVPGEREKFEKLHAAIGIGLSDFGNGFWFEHKYCTLESLENIEPVDVIYFDAFSPVLQPALWEMDVFKKLRNWLHPNGVLVTYCAKGQVKRNLKAAGFTVTGIPGPPGKREMTRASLY